VPELSEADGILGGVSGEIPRSLSEQARWQAGVITRKQALDSGISAGAIRWKIKSGVWRQVYWGVYATFTGPLTRDAQLWAAVLFAGPGAQLSHETAAEILRLTDRCSPVIHVAIPADRRVVPPKGVAIHLSSYVAAGWRFARGVPPHTFAEETIIDLVHAATDRDDVVAYVTGAFARNLTSEVRLRKAIAIRRKLRWRADLDEIVPKAAAGTHSVLEYRYDRDVERAHGLPTASKQAPFVKPDGSRGSRDRCYDEYDLIVELDGQRYHPEERRRLDRDRDTTPRQPPARRSATAGTTSPATAALRPRRYIRRWPGAATPAASRPAPRPAAHKRLEDQEQHHDELVALAGTAEHDLVPGRDGRAAALRVPLAARTRTAGLVIGGRLRRGLGRR
jgi:hypothetical protein